VAAPSAADAAATHGAAAAASNGNAFALNQTLHVAAPVQNAAPVDPALRLREMERSFFLPETHLRELIAIQRVILVVACAFFVAMTALLAPSELPFRFRAASIAASFGLLAIPAVMNLRTRSFRHRLQFYRNWCTESLTPPHPNLDASEIWLEWQAFLKKYGGSR